MRYGATRGAAEESGRVPIGRLAALTALAVGLLLVTQTSNKVRWRAVRLGVEFATMRGDPYCRQGSSQIAVLRLDPARVKLRVLHFTQTGESKPLTILDWQRYTGALAVFNAGQYYPDYSYMGLLVSDGRRISSRPHPRFRAALVANPRSGEPGARVLDLEVDQLDARRPAWRDVAQSFMLFDRTGRLRVRRSNMVANRTVVAEDAKGRLVAITTEGGYTLSDLARWLQDGPLQITHAMAMDGGYEAELCVEAAGFRYASFGRWDVNDDPSAPGAQVMLPAVIAVVEP